ncbi:nicotinate-nucleotide adenylyltransferase [Hyphomicrobium sp.]|uniref:nicotinate-nucleotide adenylyltransferase n=1 Tax=Hyphomicrobium sp. TaxID=82 RepID=UPI002D797E36|nr:nicotinate-nucleotide adenylyltransferase [Hyphomicrobium sp.]HET6388279.1 nicotinate-nucleotide adenylyltransferase [Hyphomicrobium sp.]
MTRKIPQQSFGSLRVKTPSCLPGQRIGVMGGTFNPPHEGHRTAAEAAMKRLGLDQLWWLVTPGNPLKSNNGLPDLHGRMKLVQTFARGPKMKITGFERELGTRYTAGTLAYLKRRYPGVRFVWIMGADNLAYFDRWQHWRQIAETMPIAVVDRPGWRHRGLSSPAARALQRYRLPESEARHLAGRAPPAWMLLSIKLSGLSSTALRTAAAPALAQNN